jgi:ribosomal protein S14
MPSSFILKAYARTVSVHRSHVRTLPSSKLLPSVDCWRHGDSCFVIKTGFYVVARQRAQFRQPAAAGAIAGVRDAEISC